MAFCGNCGAQMDASERFCVKCGNDNGMRPAAVPVATPVAVAPPPPAAPAPPVAPFPSMYAAPPPGAIPVAVGLPPQIPAKKSGTLGTLIVLAVLAGGGYYYYAHQNPKPATPPQPAPSNSDLAKQQDFTYGQPYTSNGYLEIPGGKWVNNASVALASATLECDQKDTNGNPLAQMRATLTGPNGPVQPGGTVTFNTIQMGSVATYVNKVNCVIVHVKQQGQ
jgi:hypothetical protein